MRACVRATVCVCMCVGNSRYLNARRHLVCMRNGSGLITSEVAEIFPAFCLFFQNAIFRRHYVSDNAVAGWLDRV